MHQAPKRGRAELPGQARSESEDSTDTARRCYGAGMQDDLQVHLFFFASSVPLGIEAMKAAGLRLRVGFGALAAACLALGLFWPRLKDLYPPLTAWFVELAGSPQTWFLLVVLVLVALAAAGRRARQDRIIVSETGLSPELRAELARVPDELRQQRDIMNDSHNKIVGFRSEIQAFGQRLDRVERGLEPKTESFMATTFPRNTPAKDRFEQLEDKIEGAKSYA